MLKKIVQTTAVNGLGNPPDRNLFTVPAGAFAGRRLVVVETAVNELMFASADAPYANWSDLSLIAADAGTLPFDAAMDAGGNVYVAYSELGTGYLSVRKLTFSDGEWTVGDAALVYNGDFSMAPSIVIETSGRIWISWSRVSAGYIDIQVKTSDDSGATWGSGPSDPGETLRAGMPAGQSRLVLTAGNVYAVYVGTGTDICMRGRLLSGGEWSSEYGVASGDTIDEQFDAAGSADGLLGVAFDDGQLKYREFDGSSWGAVIILDNAGASFPQLSFAGSVPVVCYLREYAPGQHQMVYTHRRDGSFGEPEVLDNRCGLFDGVIVYDSSSQSYTDLTAPAADAAIADVWHPDSGCLLKNEGDELYLGMAAPFRYVRFLLSTAGVGGGVIYSYWDGLNWKSFTPVGGCFGLDSADRQLILWEDFVSIAADWQRCAVDGASRYWVKVTVSSGFTTGPVGSMITAVSDVNALATGR